MLLALRNSFASQQIYVPWEGEKRKRAKAIF